MKFEIHNWTSKKYCSIILTPKVYLFLWTKFWRMFFIIRNKKENKKNVAVIFSLGKRKLAQKFHTNVEYERRDRELRRIRLRHC